MGQRCWHMDGVQAGETGPPDPARAGRARRELGPVRIGLEEYRRRIFGFRHSLGMPRRGTRRWIALHYLAAQLPEGRPFGELDFKRMRVPGTDHCAVRRYLVDAGFLDRSGDGREYRRSDRHRSFVEFDPACERLARELQTIWPGPDQEIGPQQPPGTDVQRIPPGTRRVSEPGSESPLPRSTEFRDDGGRVLLPAFPTEGVLIPHGTMDLIADSEPGRSVLRYCIDTFDVLGVICTSASGLVDVGCVASVEPILDQAGVVVVRATGTQRFDVRSPLSVAGREPFQRIEGRLLHDNQPEERDLRLLSDVLHVVQKIVARYAPDVIFDFLCLEDGRREVLFSWLLAADLVPDDTPDGNDLRLRMLRCRSENRRLRRLQNWLQVHDIPDATQLRLLGHWVPTRLWPMELRPVEVPLPKGRWFR